MYIIYIYVCVCVCVYGMAIETLCPFFIKWICHVTLYKFKVYSLLLQYTDILWLPIQWYLSYYIIIFSLCIILYFRSLFFFTTCYKSVPLNTITLILHPHSLVNTIFTFLDSTCKQNHKYLPFSVWLILLSIMHSRSIHMVTNGRIFSYLIAE